MPYVKTRQGQCARLQCPPDRLLQQRQAEVDLVLANVQRRGDPKHAAHARQLHDVHAERWHADIVPVRPPPVYASSRISRMSRASHLRLRATMSAPQPHRIARVCDVAVGDIASEVTVAPQSPPILTGTLRDNLA